MKPSLSENCAPVYHPVITLQSIFGYAGTFCHYGIFLTKTSACDATFQVKFSL
jgi:hypothetical protein